jgi:hypothetical protein
MSPCSDSCLAGIRLLLPEQGGRELSALADHNWRPWELRRGIQIAEAQCPSCSHSLPLLRCTLSSVAFILPGMAIYRRINSGRPCIALGIVDPSVTTMSRKPDRPARRLWQGIFWDLHSIAFVDVIDGTIGGFEPDHDWPVGEPPDDFDSLVTEVSTQLMELRRTKQIPAGTSSVKYTCAEPHRVQ